MQKTGYIIILFFGLLIGCSQSGPHSYQPQSLILTEPIPIASSKQITLAPEDPEQQITIRSKVNELLNNKI